MKFILVLFEGLGGRPLASLGQKTPLQVARTPNLNKLAVLGANGRFQASFSGRSLPSEIVHYLMFGHSLSNFPGRGLLKAVGKGIKFDDQDVIMLARLCNIKRKSRRLILSLERDEIKGGEKEIGKLLQTLGPYEIDKIRFEIHQTSRNESLLVLKGPVSPYISDSDPVSTGLPMAKVVPLENNPEPRKAAITSRLLNRYLLHCHQLMSHLEHPSKANFLATQGAGRRQKQISFQSQWGINGKIISPDYAIIGLAKELDMDFSLADDSADPTGDLRRKIRLALEETRCDFVQVHVKVPLEVAQSDDQEKKRKLIEQLDSGLEELLAVIDMRRDILLAVAANNDVLGQPKLAHSDEPGPVMLIGPSVRRDAVRRFDEINAASGGLGLLKGSEILHVAISYLDRGLLGNHRLGAADVPFYPPPYEPFEPN